MPKSIKTLGKFLIGGAINCLSNSDLLKEFAKSGATAAVATGGLSLGPTIIAALVNAVSGNLVSEQLQKLADSKSLWRWLKKEHPDKINGDLERLIKQSAIRAFSLLEQLYLDETKKDAFLWQYCNARERNKYLNELKSFFSYAQKELTGEINVSDINKSHIEEPDTLLSKLCNYIFLVPENIRLDEKTQSHFISFYQDKMKFCFELGFKEALKDDERGFKAFEIWVLEDLKSQNKILTQKVDELIKEIKTNKPLGPEQLDLIIKDQTRLILQILKRDFENIDEKLSVILSTSELTFRSLGLLSKDLNRVSRNIDSLMEQSTEMLDIVRRTKLIEDPNQTLPVENVPNVHESELKCLERKVILKIEDATGKRALCQDEMKFRVLKDIETYDDVFSSDSSYLTDITTHPGAIIKRRHENGKYIVTTKLDKKYRPNDLLNYVSSCIYIDCHHETSSYFSVWSDYKMDSLTIIVCFPHERKYLTHTGYKKSSMLDRVNIELDSAVEEIVYLGLPALRLKIDSLKLFDKYTINWEW